MNEPPKAKRVRPDCVRFRLRKAQDYIRSAQRHNNSVAVDILADSAIELVEKAIRISLNVPHA